MLSAVVLVTLVSTSGCLMDGKGKGPWPEEPQAPNEVIFRIDTFEIGGGLTPVAREALLIISGIQPDGQVAKYINKDGETVPGPESKTIHTPFEYTATFGPGVVAMSVTAKFVGKLGDAIICQVRVNGTYIDSVASTGYVGSKDHEASATCLWTVAA